MPAVQHMKWYGWGVEGVSFHHEDKPGLQPFVQKVLDVDLNTPPAKQPQLSDLDIPAPVIGEELLAGLRGIVGEENTVSEDEDRVVHTYGKSWPDRGRPPVHVTFGEPLRPEEGEKVAQFSERIAKEVRSLYDYTTSYRDDHA